MVPFDLCLQFSLRLASPIVRNLVVLAFFSLCTSILHGSANVSTNSFVNFESTPIHPLDLDPSGTRLALANLAAARLEIYDVNGGAPRLLNRISTGLDPVAVRWRTTNEIWVVSQLSDAVQIVDLAAGIVVDIIAVGDAPADVVFAGNPVKAFISVSGKDRLEVFDASSRQPISSIPLAGNRPKSLAVSSDQKTVYVGIQESGNATTILAPFADLLGHIPGPSVVDYSLGPTGGLNPPPNSSGTNREFNPSVNLALTNPPPKTSLIVRKMENQRWLDGDGRDWTEYVSGTNAYLSGRLPGWDLPDRDLAIVDANRLTVSYRSSLMNLCQSVAVNPVNGVVAVVGTDAKNEIRFEPQLNSIFIQSRLALIDPSNTSLATLKDLNPHLTYRELHLPPSQRAESLADPRSAIWSHDGKRLYVTGQGSANLAVFDADGKRQGRTLSLGEFAGPIGFAMDSSSERLFVWNRFSAELVTIDLHLMQVTTRVPIIDPTPDIIRQGRRVFLDAQRFSGLGQASCASCHPEGRFDRLAWDLGDPKGNQVSVASHAVTPDGEQKTRSLHPMKGPMVTQTLQDIIGHEPFHWRADRIGIEEFGQTFTNLQSADRVPTPAEMEAFKGFLASLTFPPNPNRNLDNSLPTKLPIPGHLATGRGKLPPGTQLPPGNAQSGLTFFRNDTPSACTVCHTLPTGLSPNAIFDNGWRDLRRTTNGHARLSVVELARADSLPFKVSALRSTAEKIGFDRQSNSGTSGFGFLHDGSVDTLSRMFHDSFRVNPDQDLADLIAFILSFTGSDLPTETFTGNVNRNRPPGPPSRDVPAATGKSLLVFSGSNFTAFNSLLQLAKISTNRLELIVQRGSDGWWYDRAQGKFFDDRLASKFTADEILALARTNEPLSAQLVPKGTGRVRTIDFDDDSFLNGDEVAVGSDPYDSAITPLVVSSLQPSIVRVVDNEKESVRISWNALPGIRYQLQYRNQWEESWTTFLLGETDNYTDIIGGEDLGLVRRFYHLAGTARGLESTQDAAVYPDNSESTLTGSLAFPAIDFQRKPMPTSWERSGNVGLADNLLRTNFFRQAFTNLNLSGAQLPGLEFSFGEAVNGKFLGANMRGATLLAGDFNGSDFSEAILDGADLREVDFSNGVFEDTSFHLARASQANFKGATLDGADLHSADLGEADFTVASLIGADLRGANLINADLGLADMREGIRDSDTRFDSKDELIWKLVHEGGVGADLKNLDLSVAFLRGVDFSRAKFGANDLTGTDLVGCNLSGCNLSLARMDGTLLHLSKIDTNTVFSAKMSLVWMIVHNRAKEVKLTQVDLSGAWILLSEIQGIDFSKSSLRRCSLAEVSAQGANFSGVNLSDALAQNADFRDANFRGANFSNANLTGANFLNADLTNANLTRADLRGANLRNTDLTGVIFRETIMPDGRKRDR